MQDIPAIAEVAHRHGAVVVMDNTWATPLLFPPHERGVDMAIEAGTKYLSGGFRPPARPGLGQRALLQDPTKDL